MTGAEPADNRRGELLYALSFVGAHIGFMPLLILLLPRRVVTIAPEHALSTLSGLLVLGGVVAGLANIAAGAIGDVWLATHGNRRAVIAAGLAGLVGSYTALATATTVPALAAGIVCFQLTLNLMLAPLGALMTDYIPDARKGRVAGWLNAGLPVSILSVTVLAHYAPADGAFGYFVVAALVVCLVLPLLLLWPFGKSDAAPFNANRDSSDLTSRVDRRDLAYAAVARLLIQLGAALIINYLFIYLVRLRTSARLVDLPEPTAAVVTLALISGGASIFGSLVAGYYSDSRRHRRVPMIVAALSAAAALTLISDPVSWRMLIVTSGVFQAALTAYLAIDAALVAQLVGKHPNRGTFLGFMNLTNTVPTICVPILALINVAQAPDLLVISHLLILFSATTASSAVFIGFIRSTS